MKILLASLLLLTSVSFAQTKSATEKAVEKIKSMQEEKIQSEGIAITPIAETTALVAPVELPVVKVRGPLLGAQTEDGDYYSATTQEKLEARDGLEDFLKNNPKWEVVTDETNSKIVEEKISSREVFGNVIVGERTKYKLVPVTK